MIHLDLKVESAGGCQIEGMNSIEWLHLLCQFFAVQLLYVSQGLAGYVASVLENLTGEMAAKVLPSLDLICLEGQPSSSVEKFVSTRQLSGHPVTVIDTKTKFNDRLVSSISK